MHSIAILGDSWVDDTFAKTIWTRYLFPTSPTLGKKFSKILNIQKQSKIVLANKYIIHVGGNDFSMKLPSNIVNHYIDSIRLYWGLPSIYYRPLSKKLFGEYSEIVKELALSSNVVVCNIPIGPAVPISRYICLLTAPFQSCKICESIHQIIHSRFNRQFLNLQNVKFFDIYKVIKNNNIVYTSDGLHPTENGHKIIAKNYKEEEFIIKEFKQPIFTTLEACIGTACSIISGLVFVPLITFLNLYLKNIKV